MILKGSRVGLEALEELCLVGPAGAGELMLRLLGLGQLPRLAPHHRLRQDQWLLRLVVVHFLQVSHVPELHPASGGLEAVETVWRVAEISI